MAILGILTLIFVVISLAIMAEMLYSRLKSEENKNANEEVCDACGKNPKAPDSQICKECQKKAYDD